MRKLRPCIENVLIALVAFGFLCLSGYEPTNLKDIAGMVLLIVWLICSVVIIGKYGTQFKKR